MDVERILFMSAGASIDKTYPVTAEYFKPTHVYVIVEKTIFEDSELDSDFLKQEKPKIRQAIKNVETQVPEYPGRKYKLLKISSLNQQEIQAAVMGVRNQNKDAKYCFNITAGTALFTATLFLMGIWLDGETCITREGSKEPIILTIPRLSLNELETDENLRNTILAIGEEKNPISNKKLAQKLGYIRQIQERIPKNDKVTLSRLMKKLQDEWKLVTIEKVGRESIYTLTDNGIFAYNLFKNC